MAVNDGDSKSGEQSQAPDHGSPGPAGSQAGSGGRAAAAGSESGGPGAPAWVVPLYVGGLVLLYVGERVLSTFDTARWVASGLGLSAVLAATAVRFLPARQAGGERGSIDRLLGVLSVIGLAGLGVYLTGTEWGLERLGLLDAADETRERVETALTIAWVVLIVGSVVPMLFAEAALYPMRNAERLESRRVRAAAASGLVLALAATYGSLFVYSAGGAEVKADFSYFKTSEPSESTLKLVEGLKEPIKVTAFFPEVSAVRPEVASYLKQLAAGASNLEVAVHDRYLAPKLAEELKVVQDGIIVIARGDAKRTVHIGTDMSQARSKLKTLDRDFQERLYKLLRSRRNIYLTVGHGELNDDARGFESAAGREAKLLKKLLQKQHYLVKNLGLTQGLATDVPDDADIVMILGPTQPFAPEAIASLRRYADRGGKLFIALDPEAISTQDLAQASEPAAELQPAGFESGAPGAGGGAAEDAPQVGATDGEGRTSGRSATERGLAELAGIVGLEFSSAILANDRQFVRRRYNDSDRTLLLTNRFSSHASVSTLSRNSARAAVLVAGAGSLERKPGATEKVDFALRALAGTFADVNRNYRFDEGEERKSFAIAAAVSKPVEGSQDHGAADEKADELSAPPLEMRAFVLADADALSDIVLANFMTNQLLVVDAVRWLGGEESFAGEVNVEEDVRIEHTQQKDRIWFYSTIFGAPALVLGLGLLYSRQSRRTRARKAQGGKG